jgi:hypothetical protein
MNQDHLLEMRKPTYVERMKVYLLVGKIMVDRDGVFESDEMEFIATMPKSVEWNKNIQDFLDVVVGATVGDNIYHECYAALTFPYDETEVSHD